MPHMDKHKTPKLLVTNLKVSHFKYFSYQNNTLKLHDIAWCLPEYKTGYVSSGVEGRQPLTSLLVSNKHIRQGPVKPHFHFLKPPSCTLSMAKQPLDKNLS